jgi:hypothetical protein
VKRTLVALLFILAAGAVAGHLVRDRLAAAAVERIVPVVAARAAAHGLECRDLRYSRVSMEGFAGTVVVHEPACRLHVTPATADDLARSLSTGEPHGGDLALSARRVSLSFGGLPSQRLRLALQDGTVARIDSATGEPTGEGVAVTAADVTAPLPGWRPRAAVARLRSEAQRLLEAGRTGLPLSLEAVVTLQFAGRPYELRLRSEPDGPDTRIVLDRDDLRRLGRSHVPPLTEAEIEVVATSPARAPRLLRLSQIATEAAAAELSRDPTFPDDAYRHVYWSWLLTREFGAEFAERVTDAHEEGATYEFGEAQRRMDLINNALGREYAAADVAPHEIAGRVRSDPRVVRSQADVLRVGGG